MGSVTHRALALDIIISLHNSQGKGTDGTVDAEIGRLLTGGSPTF